MALVKCNNCGHMVSDKADVCPKCGASVTQAPVETQPQQEAVSNNPNKPKQKGVLIACVVAVLLLIGGGAAWYFHGGNKPTQGDNDHPVYSEELRKKAEAGDAVAQSDLGVCFEHGYGVGQSIDEAVKWYKQSAEQGCAAGQRNLGIAYQFGNGVNQSIDDAIKLYRMAAEQKDAIAQYKLGACYSNGIGVSQNLEEAFKYFRLSAEQGLAISQGALGVFYEQGYVVEQDYVEAVNWFRKAAEKNDCVAQYNLGACYSNGHGVKQDHVEAAKWTRMAAEQGYDIAQYVLGAFYLAGQGVEKNESAAKEWFQKAAAQGYQPAIDYLNGGSSVLQANDVNTTWDYFQDTDDLTGNVTAVNAALNSTNAVEYDNYGHTSKLFILLTYSAKGETQITIGGVDATGSEKMRFSDFQGSGFLAVFDDGEVDDTWRYIGMSERRTSLYIHHTHEVAEFVSKLKASRTCKIQVNLEHGGKKAFTFNTVGLKWDY